MENTVVQRLNLVAVSASSTEEVFPCGVYVSDHLSRGGSGSSKMTVLRSGRQGPVGPREQQATQPSRI
jgi:hypothetical protein